MRLHANGVYKIYTYSDGTSTGATKYYLKSDGYLTDDASAAGQFTFDLQRIFGGYKMAGYRINHFTNGGNANNVFSGDALKKIVTSSQNRSDWEAQVFFKNEDGFAIRSTNSTSASWGASAFWTVVADNDEDGLPNATYTVNAVPYVWQLEMVTAGDFSDVTAKYITNYNPVANANGWTATNGNRLNQWASNPITFDSGNNCAETWNNQGATLKQTLHLPAGYYDLTAIALARSGHTTTLSAGSASTPIVTVESETVNNRNQANTWFNNGNGRKTLSFTVDSESDVEIGLTTGTTGDAWTVWRAFYLTYNSTPVSLRKALAQAKEAANAAMASETYNIVTGYERTQLVASVAKTVEESGTPSIDMPAYNALIAEIAEKLSAFQNAPKYYEQLAGENTRAEMFGLPAATAEEQDAVTACDLQAKAVYNYVMTNYNTMIELGEWTTVNAGTMSSQHWDGTNTSSYNEQAEGWNSSDPWTTSYSQDIVLPAGDYVFKVAGRHEQYATLTLNVKKGEEILGTVSDFPTGNEGRGIATNGIASFAADATYANNGAGRGWQWRYVPFTIEEESATITISVEGGNPEEKEYQWLSFCNYTVQSGPSIAASTLAYNQAKEVADAALASDTYANVQGTDRSNLVAAVNADKGTTIESIDEATENIRTYTPPFTAGVASWNDYANNYPAEKAKADAISEEIAAGIAAPNTAAEAGEAVHNLMVAEYNYVTTNYSYAVNLGSWNASANAGTLRGQHWDGTSTSTYMEQGAGDKAYNLNSWTVTYDQSIALPAGNYVFKVAGRTASDHVTINLNVTDVTDGENPVLLGTVNDFPKGDTGLGINKAGVTSFDPEDEAGFANNGAGRGWQWRYVKFTLADPATVKVAVVAEADAQYRWMGFCNATVQTDDAENVAIMEALVALNDAKTAATLTQHGNVGEGAFKYDADTEPTLWSNYSTAKENAEAFTLTSTSTTEEITALTTALNTAIENYNALELTEPTEGQAFNIILTYGGYTYDNKAMTYLANARTGEGDYNIQYAAEPNANYAQAFTFTKVDGNNYKLSQIDEDGNVRYITDKKTGGYSNDGTASIRTTTDESKAAAYKIIATSTEGVYNIYNNVANNYIGSQDAGVFTVNSHIDFKIVEAEKANVEGSLAAGKLATRIFPFTPKAIDGIKYYSVEETHLNGNETHIVPVEVKEPVANTPYIVYNETEEAINITQSGWGTATKDVYSAGALTGVYTNSEIAADAGNYILQTQNDVQAFYLVSSSARTATPYRAYLTAPGAGARIAISFDNETTGINGVNATEKKFDGTVYDLSGRKVAQPARGLYIVNGKKVVIK